MFFADMWKKRFAERNVDKRSKTESDKIRRFMKKSEFDGSVIKNYCENFHNADDKNNCAGCLEFVFLMRADYRISGNQGKKNDK